MDVLIAYATRLGSTRGIAERIAARIGADGLTASVAPVESVTDLAGHDAFVIGSAVYAGQWLATASGFVEKHRATLSSHPVWLFSSGPVGRTATAVAPVHPSGIDALGDTISARGHRVFAGALDRQTLDDADLGAVERFIAKRFVPEGDFRDWPEIDAWADEIARELSPLTAGRR
jgi:menaquinone-dependent protoporphyrinogen oxidase